ncbi:DUF6602 domain-containing protein [Candidatus Izemoplasma sp. B36]|uniref:DUF6602 domain-containing protein n=1 Tax=Candidatus Izemoplasma sp. B36 TaxID=3242468 RepID=UPI003557EA88
MSYLREIFRVREDNLKRLFKIKISHNPSDGRFREDLIKTILDIVPQKYNVSNGFIIDTQGNLSNEMDLIIFDDIYVPKFFMETYSVIPIESVVAVVQIKTKLDSTKLKNAIINLNSIDKLTPQKGGKIISASKGTEIIEERFILPLKIIVCGSSSTILTADKCSDIDIIYSIGKEEKDLILIKNIESSSIVSKECNIENMRNNRKNNKNYNINSNEKLYKFSFAILKYLTLINNSMIVNYEEY